MMCEFCITNLFDKHLPVYVESPPPPPPPIPPLSPVPPTSPPPPHPPPFPPIVGVRISDGRVQLPAWLLSRSNTPSSREGDGQGASGERVLPVTGHGTGQPFPPPPPMPIGWGCVKGRTVIVAGETKGMDGQVMSGCGSAATQAECESLFVLTATFEPRPCAWRQGEGSGIKYICIRLHSCHSMAVSTEQYYSQHPALLPMATVGVMTAPPFRSSRAGGADTAEHTLDDEESEEGETGGAPPGGDSQVEPDEGETLGEIRAAKAAKGATKREHDPSEDQQNTREVGGDVPLGSNVDQAVEGIATGTRPDHGGSSWQDVLVWAFAILLIGAVIALLMRDGWIHSPEWVIDVWAACTAVFTVSAARLSKTRQRWATSPTTAGMASTRGQRAELLPTMDSDDEMD